MPADVGGEPPRASDLDSDSSGSLLTAHGSLDGPDNLDGMAITATEDTTTPASGPPRGARSRTAWLFPTDQPRWARPGLLAVAALAALIFTWGAFHTATNNFYAADARSMSMSWKNFLYGAFDPAGSVTIDKLWGFLWPQALCRSRSSGHHSWALALPEAVEGVISVLVLLPGSRGAGRARSDIARCRRPGCSPSPRSWRPPSATPASRTMP